MIDEQLKRVTDYIDTLKEGGAGHQVQLAEDLSAVIGYYGKHPRGGNTPVDDRDEMILNLKASVASLMDERDEARAELKLHKTVHGIHKEAKEEDHAALKNKAKAATKHK